MKKNTKHTGKFLLHELFKSSLVHQSPRSKTFLKRYPWVVQLVEQVTPGFGSGPNLRILRSSPALGSELSEESA